MALFTANDPLKAAIGERDKQAERLKGEQVKATDCAAIVDRLTHELADDAKLDAAHEKLAIADRKVAERLKQVAKAGDLVAEMEARAAAAADKKLRAETAAAHEQVADDIQRDGAALVQSIAVFAETSRRAATLVADAHGLVAFATGMSDQIGPAVDMVGQILRHQAVLTLNGSARAGLPAPEQAAPRQQREAPPAMQRVFAMKHLKFIDGDGNLRRIPKMMQVDLKPEHASKALKRAWAIPLNDPRVHGLSGSYSQQLPDLHLCEDLDSDSTPSGNVEPIRHSALDKPTSPARVGIMSRPPPAEPMAATATRSLPPDSEG